MRAKELVSGIEERKLQCVDNTSDGVDHTSGNQPDKCCDGKGLDQRNHGQDTEPAHGNVNDGREPFRAGDPECLDQHTDDGNGPIPVPEADSPQCLSMGMTQIGV